jgi:hypothetical protein
MVRGLDLFRDKLKECKDSYVLIGGAACDLAMQQAGLGFRATKDLDIVLQIEMLNKSFCTALWEFIQAGKYQSTQQSTGQRQFYRFSKPETEGYPFMLELFSRRPDSIQVPEGCHLTPIPTEEDVSSLSAILLNDDYYSFLCSGRMEIENVPVVGAEHLIALKAHAWLDLTRREKDGEQVDSKDIKKHKNDVFRLYRIIDPAKIPEVPETVRVNMASFLDAMQAETVDLKSLGIHGSTTETVLADLRMHYCGA